MKRRTLLTTLCVALASISLAAAAGLSPVKKSSRIAPAAAPPEVAVDGGQTTVPRPYEPVFPIPDPGQPPRPSNLDDAMHHLWVDHIVWSRMTTMSIFSDLKGNEVYEERLATNIVDMTNLLLPYYGKEVASEFSNLFAVHVGMASDVFNAYKTGDKTLIRDTTYAWYQNADEIASFLCKVNPAWDYAEMKSMWRMHLDTVVDEALDYKAEDYQGDVMCYDVAQDHIFALADYLTEGILQQFPEKN